MPLDPAKDTELQRRHLQGDREAHAELVARYLPLARSLARRYSSTGEPVEDLIQVASLGLIHALQRWDPERGVAFSSFAVPTILGQLRRYFRENTWAVRPPRGTQELAVAVLKARDRLARERPGTPTVAEIARAVRRSREDVLGALQAVAARRAESLEAPVVGDDDQPATSLDRLGATEAGYDRVDDALFLEELTALLDERAREVLRLRFAEDMLQRDIAVRVGCSQMHVSRILADSLDKLRLVAALRRPEARQARAGASRNSSRLAA
jgi:RNA polymerase sigma-B factor